MIRMKNNLHKDNEGFQDIKEEKSLSDVKTIEASKVKNIKLQYNIPYSNNIQKYIKKHKRRIQEYLEERKQKKQSKNLYRNDNLCKKTWRSLRLLVTLKAKELIKSPTGKSQEDIDSFEDKIKSFLKPFEMASDKRTYYTLLACMIFLAIKQNHIKIIKKLKFEPKIHEFMTQQAKKFKTINNNKTKGVEWIEIYTHPVFALGKTLLYSDYKMQDAFFKKLFGCNKSSQDKDSKTRMTIIDDYEYFRVKILNILEKRFISLY